MGVKGNKHNQQGAKQVQNKKKPSIKMR